MRIVLTAILFLVLPGCSGVRFAVDVIPLREGLAETEVAQSASGGSDKVALIDVTGMIADARAPGLIGGGENPVDRLVTSLRRAADDRHVKAVILRINSPGGTVTASDVMYREVMRFKERTGKPVIVLMADLAASGGYYLACAGDWIIAHPTTVTGSIGVIMQTFSVAEGMAMIGIRADAITSGPNKAVGSPFAPMKADHRALLQGIVNEYYEGFRGLVASSRPGLKADDMHRITDGRVITGRHAAEISLVDQTGDLYDAFDIARDRANLNRARLVKYHRWSAEVGSAYANTPVPLPSLIQVSLPETPISQPGFLYLWDPTVW